MTGKVKKGQAGSKKKGRKVSKKKGQAGGKKFKDTRFGRAVKKGNALLKKTKLLSEVAGVASDLGIKGADRAGRVLNRAGYGKQRGGALKF